LDKKYKLRKNFQTFIYKNPKDKTLVLSNSNRRFEFVYFIFFRKTLKYFMKRARKKRTNFLCKICIISNYWLSKKSQNSRMGKGKGIFLRKCFLIKKNQPILITKGVNESFLHKFTDLIEKKLNFNFCVQSNFQQFTSGTLCPRSLLCRPSLIKRV